MNAHEIRSDILISLADLYEDWLHRRQYKRFTFSPADQPIAQEILRELASHLLIEEKLPGIVRLTNLGYSLLQDEINQLRSEMAEYRPGSGGSQSKGITPPA
jgi:hypothetical protein